MPGPPVVLVHGLASSFDHGWRKPGWVDILADVGREVIPVDLLGHGTAPAPHDPAEYADLEGRVRDVLPDAPVDVVGFSMGARVVLTLAAETPERFNRIVVGGVGANLFVDADREPLARALESNDTEATGIPGLFVRFSAANGNDQKAVAACLRRDEPAMTAEQLGRITRPVLVVIGDKDFVGPADPLVDALPDARLKVLRNVDHFRTPEDFGFIDATLDFLGATP